MGVGVITPPPLVAENFVCSNSNSLVAITPPPPSGQAGGREGRVGQRGQKEILPEGGIDHMY